jgi:hypothetical protein
MAKLNREARLRERRVEKNMRKEARRYAAENPPDPESLIVESSLIVEDADSPDPEA